MTQNYPKPFSLKPLAILLACSAFASCSRSNGGQAADQPEIQIQTILEMYTDYRADFEGIAEVTPAQIKDAFRADELTIVDVRTTKERAISMIPGAITKETFEKDTANHTDKRVVIHCTIGYRSGVYVKELSDRGIKAENMIGSLLLWTHEGLPLEDSQGNPTKRVHVYGKKWNLLPADYEAIW